MRRAHVLEYMHAQVSYGEFVALFGKAAEVTAGVSAQKGKKRRSA